MSYKRADGQESISYQALLDKNRVLENLHFPLNKQNLIQQAIKHGASHVVIEELKNIPGKEYTSFSIVVKELGGKRLS